MDRILIINFNPNAWVQIHKGFEELGCTVLNHGAPEGWKDYTCLEQDLNGLLNTFRPDAVFSYGWWINRVNIDAFSRVLAERGILHAYWAIDDPDLFRLISLPMAKKADLVFTTDAGCIDAYKEQGADARFLIYGCNPSVHRRVPPEDAYRHDLVLMAHNYNVWWNPGHFSYRLAGINHILRPLVENDYDLMVWGLWWQDPDRIYHLPDKNYGSALPPGHEAQVYSSAKIVLGLQSVGTSTSMLSIRTFEALCCGAFHLSQYSPALEHYFRKGIHMEWSRSPEETLELADFYLKRDSARERIARQGRREVLEKYTLKHSAASALEVLKGFR